MAGLLFTTKELSDFLLIHHFLPEAGGFPLLFNLLHQIPEGIADFPEDGSVV
jgi:hypothetical protein